MQKHPEMSYKNLHTNYNYCNKGGGIYFPKIFKQKYCMKYFTWKLEFLGN